MKALSIRQPWAWLIVHGHKDVENRSWPTKFRGRFFVHASQKFDHDGYLWVRRHFPKIKMPLPGHFPTGAIVGYATLTDCVTKSKSKWFAGENYGFVIEGAGAHVGPLSLKGKLGFFETEWDDGTEGQDVT